LVGALPPGRVELMVDGDELKLRSGNFKATLQGINSSEFPDFPKKEGSPGSIDISLLSEIVDKVGFSSSSDESRPVLTGVLWDFGAKLNIAATDGYRLSLLRVKKGEKINFSTDGDNKQLLLPGGILREVSKVFSDAGEDKVALHWSEAQRQIFFSAGDIEVVVRLLEGEFPSYQAIIPKENKIEALIEKTELLQSVKVAAIFARESANIIKWSLSKEGLLVSANSPQVGENSTLVPVDFLSAGDGEIAFNSRYLLDLLSRIEGDKVKFSMNDALKPGVFQEESNSGFLHVIMPVRVQGDSKE